MKILEVIKLVVAGAQIAMPTISIAIGAVESIIDMIAQLRSLRTPEANRVADSLSKYETVDPETPVTDAEIQAILDDLNPPLEFDLTGVGDKTKSEVDDEEDGEHS